MQCIYIYWGGAALAGVRVRVCVCVCVCVRVGARACVRVHVRVPRCKLKNKGHETWKGTLNLVRLIRTQYKN